MKKLLFVVLATLSLASCRYTMNEQIEGAKINKTERVTNTDSDGNSESKYMVYTDKGTFVIEDDLFRGNFTSSDWYGFLKEGDCYSFQASGYRSGFLSEYQNITTRPKKCDCP